MNALMLGRINRSQDEPAAMATGVHDDESLIGGGGVSLDGKSLQLPDGAGYYDDRDEISSINTSNYGGPSSSALRILGSAPQEPTMVESSIPVNDIGSRDSSSLRKGKAAAGGAAGPAGFLPPWIANAPSWLKGVIVLSVVLFVGAIVLIAVASGVSSGTSKGETSAANGSTPSSSISIAPSPTVSPVTTSPTSPPRPGEPTETPSPSYNKVTPTPNAETAVPTTTSTLLTGTPTTPAVNNVTAAPSVAQGTSLTFYLIAGRFNGDVLTELTNNLPTIPSVDGDSFMVHLGDWNSPFATSCSEASYQEVSNLYSTSSVPVYFVPGDNEYNDCPYPTQAFGYWHTYLLDFETKYWNPGPFTVSRDEPDYPENFSFLYRNVLYVGINLVGGTVIDQTEWDTRIAADLSWIDTNFNANRDNIQALVVFGHSDPALAANTGFFQSLAQAVASDYVVPTIFFHRNLGVESFSVQQNFYGVNDFVIVVVEGSIWPPMRVRMDTTSGAFVVNQDSWYNSSRI